MPNTVLLMPVALLLTTSLTYCLFNFGKRSRVSPELVALFRTAGASESVAGHLARGDTHQAIQTYHTENNGSLGDAKYAIEQIRLAASRPDMLLAAGIPAAVVTQMERGDNIAAIKAYRTEKNVSLREAKATIDQLMDR